MNITNIKPAAIKCVPTINDSFRNVVLNPANFKSKPNAYEVRTLLINRKISQREAARMLDLPWNQFQKWIAPSRDFDVPNYILQKLKEILNDC